MAKNRDKLIERVDEGFLDPKDLAFSLLGWLSDDECVEFANANDIPLEDEDEDEEFTYSDEDEVNTAFENQWCGDDNDRPAKRQAFVEFVDSLQRSGDISEDLAFSVTLSSDES